VFLPDAFSLFIPSYLALLPFPSSATFSALILSSFLASLFLLAVFFVVLMEKLTYGEFLLFLKVEDFCCFSATPIKKSVKPVLARR